MLRNLRWVLPAILIAGCSTAPEDIAQTYLDAIAAGDVAGAKETLCNIAEGFGLAEINAIESSEILNVEQSEKDGVAIDVVDFRYTVAGMDAGTGRILLTGEALKLMNAQQAELARLGMTPTEIDPKNYRKSRCIILVTKLE